MDATETANNSNTPTRTRITHRLDNNLKTSNTIPRDDLLGLIKIVVFSKIILFDQIL